MARDKAKDDLYFNCSEEHEIRYVSNLYPGNEDKVSKFLIDKCQTKDIFFSTHLEVYTLIKNELGLSIPV